MIFASEAPVLLQQIGNLALTSNSIPSILATPLYLAVCLGLTVKNSLFRWKDFGLLLMIAAIQILLMPWIAGPNPSAFSVFALAWPTMAFMIGYGTWRLAGKQPLQDWPWYRYGLLVTLLLLLVDIGAAFILSPEQGKIWQLGGAGLLDTLVCAPPLFMLTFYLFLCCRSPLVFCSKACRSANRCLYDVAPPEPAKRAFSYAFWKRSLLSATCAALVILAYPSLTDTSESQSMPLPPDLALYIDPLVAQISAFYEINPPKVMRSNVKAHALTLQEVNGQGVTIFLGETFFNSQMVNNPDATRTVIAHEMGHAILITANQSYPKLLILFAYLLVLTILIYAMPSPVGTIIYSLIILIMIVVLVRLTGLSVHRTFQLLAIGITGLGVIWAVCISRHISTGNKYAFPRRYALMLTGTLSIIITFLGFAAIGTLNYRFEFFSDRVAACSVGAENVGQLLSVIDLRPISNEFMAAIRDPFHPSIVSRLEALKNFPRDHSQYNCKTSLDSMSR